MGWAVRVAHIVEERSSDKILIGNPEGKGLLGRIRCRWEDNIKMDRTEIGWECVDWNHLAQGKQ
jgi:hypothetical protein